MEEEEEKQSNETDMAFHIHLIATTCESLFRLVIVY